MRRAAPLPLGISKFIVVMKRAIRRHLPPCLCHDADQLRKMILERFDLSLGTGLGPLQGKLFRIGHLGSINDLMLCGTLSGVEMGLDLAGVPHKKGGVQAALNMLAVTSGHRKENTGP